MWLSGRTNYVPSSAKLYTSKFTTTSRGFPATARLSCFIIQRLIVVNLIVTYKQCMHSKLSRVTAATLVTKHSSLGDRL